MEKKKFLANLSKLNNKKSFAGFLGHSSLTSQMKERNEALVTISK